MLFEENRLAPPYDQWPADFKQVLESTALCTDIQFAINITVHNVGGNSSVHAAPSAKSQVLRTRDRVFTKKHKQVCILLSE